ncbi:MAG: alpha/beta hydrolase [Proteobacteria bacterium]|nr:alpha/beta hydrolase [Pseudomonadota bacterium]
MIRNMAIGALLAAALIAPSIVHADPVLFPGKSTLVVRDRFSDEILGNGPDIVFIPGLASSRETWGKEADRLKDRYRLHLIQVAGFAGEPARANASGPVLIPTAEAIDAYLVEQHLTPATVIGHSLGGTIVLYLAEHRGADLKKAMMVDTLPFYATLMAGPSATVEGMTPMADAIRSGKSQMTDQQRSQMMASMAAAQSDKDMIAGWSKVSDKPALSNALADDLTLDMRPELGAISTPLTLVVPDYAPLGVPDGANLARYKQDYAAVKSMTFVPVTDSLHFVMLDQPAQMDAALDRFLAN